MPVSVDIHQPVLVNTLGHCAGVLIFGSFLYLFLRDRRRARQQTSLLPAAAALLALLWNAGSVLVLAAPNSETSALRLLVAVSFSALSLLPAVLLQLSLNRRYPFIWRSGYVVSAVAMSLHAAELFTPADSNLHQWGVNLISIAFGVLTGIAILALARRGKRAETPRVMGAMASFLLAISFVHFGAAHNTHALSGELAIHHGGIPLAMLVLLGDYRFFLLDVFLRLLANATLASAFMVAAVEINDRFKVLSRAAEQPFSRAMLVIGVCLGLIAFASARNLLQRTLTRVVFRRSGIERLLQQIASAGAVAASEKEYLQSTAEETARFFRAFAESARRRN